MKLKLKLMAVAAALASMAGGAQADLTSGSSVNNGSMALVAWNTVSREWYIRDLGYLINDFLPSTITTAAADGGVTGDKTPEAGLVIDKTVKSNFGDTAFATWYAAQGATAATDVVWMVGAYDQVSSAGTGSQRRSVASSTSTTDTFTNANLDSFVSTSNFGGLSGLFNPATLSKTGSGMTISADTNGGFSSGGLLAAVNQTAYLYYNVRTAFTGSSSSLAATTPFGNSGGLATLVLEADGDLIYSLAPAAVIPLPGAVWMMGAGLVAIGGMVRRRRAAAAERV